MRILLTALFCLVSLAALGQTPSLDDLTTEKTFDSWDVACGGQKMQSVCLAASKSVAGPLRATLGGLINMESANQKNFVLRSEGAQNATIRFGSGEKFTAKCNPLCQFSGEELFQLLFFEAKVFADIQYGNGRTVTFEWPTKGFDRAFADAKVKWMLRLTK